MRPAGAIAVALPAGPAGPAGRGAPAGPGGASGTPPAAARSRHLGEPRAVRWLLIGLAMAFLVLFLFVPLLAVFAKAFEKGAAAFAAAVRDPDTLASIRLTLLTAGIATGNDRAVTPGGDRACEGWRGMRVVLRDRPYLAVVGTTYATRSGQSMF